MAWRDISSAKTVSVVKMPKLARKLLKEFSNMASQFSEKVSRFPVTDTRAEVIYGSSL